MYLLFDVGGTKMRFAVSKDGKTVGDPKIIPTPRDFNEGVMAFKRMAEELVDGMKLDAVAGGLPGPFDSGKTMIMNAPNLPEWNGKPLKEELEKTLGAPVFFENDAALAGLGEAIYGSGRGKHIVVYMTISTGVGGVRIINGKVDENVLGFEPGSQFIDYKENLTLEDMISGASIEKKYMKKPYEMTDPNFWDEMAKLLAYGINNTIVHWSPHIVVLGGSMMKEVGISIDRVKFHLKEIPCIFKQLPIIEKALFGDSSAHYGALSLIKNRPVSG
jgi:glucokinase